jgi:hypothetical protein
MGIPAANIANAPSLFRCCVGTRLARLGLTPRLLAGFWTRHFMISWPIPKHHPAKRGFPLDRINCSKSTRLKTWLVGTQLILFLLTTGGCCSYRVL